MRTEVLSIIVIGGIVFLSLSKIRHITRKLTKSVKRSNNATGSKLENFSYEGQETPADATSSVNSNYYDDHNLRLQPRSLTPQEEASLTFVLGDEPKERFAGYLPMTFSEELWVIDKIEKRLVSAAVTTIDDLVAFGWKELSYHYQENNTHIGTAQKQAALALANEIQNKRLGPETSSADKLFGQVIDYGLSIHTLEKDNTIAAAALCLIRAAMQITGRATNPPYSLWESDAHTFLSRCTSLNELGEALMPIFSALPENPEIDHGFIRAVISKRKHYLDNRLNSKN